TLPLSTADRTGALAGRIFAIVDRAGSHSAAPVDTIPRALLEIRARRHSGGGDHGAACANAVAGRPRRDGGPMDARVYDGGLFVREGIFSGDRRNRAR